MFSHFASSKFLSLPLLILTQLALQLSYIDAADAAVMAPPARTVAIQMFEWPWQDIAKECEVYLGPTGFAAVQVSPPQEHIMWENHPWWERYQVVSYKLNSRSGNEEQFTDMVKRCHAAGVDVYVDVVLNHTTGIPGGTGFGGTAFSHYSYPGMYTYNDFHHCNRNGNDDIKNFNDRYELQKCELLDLADLATESEKVRNTAAAYLNHLLDLGVTGFRIDAAKHIPADDLQAIKAKLKRSAYIYQEIIYDSRGPVTYDEYLPVGDVMAYDYGHILGNGFLNKNPYTIFHVADSFPASSDSIVFLTNHDLERQNSSANYPTSVLSYNGSSHMLYRMAQIYMLAWPYGYPFLYSGYSFSNNEQGPPLNLDFSTTPILDNNIQCHAPWTCEHRLPEIPPMVDFRNQTNGAFYVSQLWTNGYDALAFSRGAAAFVALNFSNHSIQQDFPTSMEDGFYCNILDTTNYSLKDRSCTQGYRVQNGKIRLTMPAMSAFATIKQTTVINTNK